MCTIFLWMAKMGRITQSNYKSIRLEAILSQFFFLTVTQNVPSCSRLLFLYVCVYCKNQRNNPYYFTKKPRTQQQSKKAEPASWNLPLFPRPYKRKTSTMRCVYCVRTFLRWNKRVTREKKDSEKEWEIFLSGSARAEQSPIIMEIIINNKRMNSTKSVAGAATTCLKNSPTIMISRSHVLFF